MRQIVIRFSALLPWIHCVLTLSSKSFVALARKSPVVIICITVVVTAIFSAKDAKADSPREKILLDSGWRFQLGDPAEIVSDPANTNVAYYPEIPSLDKLTTGEMTGSTSE